MRARLFLWLLVIVAVGCGAEPRPSIPPPTPFRFPPTWTPQPTATQAPPPPTATLVIQAAPADSSAPVGNTRRYPYPAYGSIGAWVDTMSLSNDVLQALAPHVQVAIGPQAGALRRINTRAIVLEQRDSASTTDGAPSLEKVLDPGYDGVLLEQVGTGPGGDPFGSSDKLLASMRVMLDTRLLIADAYAWTDGAAFQDHASDVPPLLGYLDGVCLCHFLHAPNVPLSTFETEVKWKQDVDALAALSNNPNLVVLVATRFNRVTDNELDLLQPWFDYSLTSFLLGEEGSYSYFSFQGPHAEDYMRGGELSTALGYPVGKYFPSFGVYARHFQHGLVVVNAGESVREMPLAQTYTTPSGEQLTSVQLQPHTGKILLNAP